jgi:hypothetical protein
MAELQEKVMRVFDRMRRLPAGDLALEATYYKFVGLSMTSHYAFSPQSRIAPINSMKMRDLPAMYDQQVVLADHAKTREKYGPQPILFGPDQLSIITFFLDHVRSQLQRRNPHLADLDAYIYASFRYPHKLTDGSLQMRKFCIEEAGFLYLNSLSLKSNF